MDRYSKIKQRYDSNAWRGITRETTNEEDGSAERELIETLKDRTILAEYGAGSYYEC